MALILLSQTDQELFEPTETSLPKKDTLLNLSIEPSLVLLSLLLILAGSLRKHVRKAGTGRRTARKVLLDPKL